MTRDGRRARQGLARWRVSSAASPRQTWRLPISLLAVLVVPSVQAGSDPIDYQRQTLRIGAREQTATVPAGYRLEVLVFDLQGPRLLSFAENGDLFVGSRSGKVYRLTPPYLKAEVLVELDGYPHSVASRPGELLVARTDGVYRAAFRPGQARLAPSDFSLLDTALSDCGWARYM